MRFWAFAAYTRPYRGWGPPSTILRGNMKKLFVGAAIAGMGLVGLGTGVAAATPGTVDCSNPCVNRAAADPTLTGAPWTDFFTVNNQWEKYTDPNGDGQGAWEKGVQAVNGGAWEKAFPPAP